MTLDTALLILTFAVVMLALSLFAWYMAVLQYRRSKQVLFLMYDWLEATTHHEQNNKPRPYRC